ncbi:hypothetical protein PF001_g22842 [Phytophthora fragariae]|uniref:Retrotransposon gag domain-containing protein n=2 Tax=Phytophthora fragariae TaxID=53985 RepID=A0A6A4C481_9STRA|nr:hypothetical protein PF001_g22842 [Phytophthora fragariae]
MQKKTKRKSTKNKKKVQSPEPDCDDYASGLAKGSESVKKIHNPERSLHQVALARMFKKDPIMKLLRPTLVGELTGPVLKPDVARMTDITQVAQATFRILKDAGYALGISEMERVYDWSRKTWKRMLIQLLNSLTILVGTVQAERWRPQWSQGSSREGSTGSSQYQSASSAVEGSDTDSDVGLSRLTTERERSDLHKNARTGTWSTNPAPSGIEDTFTGMMRSYAARHATANKPQMPVVPDEDQDESMRSASSRAESDPDRTALIRDPADFFDLGEELVGRPSVAAVATAGTAQPYLTRVRMSAFSELNEFSGRETSEEKFRSWFNRVRSAARRDGMDPAEICTLFGDLMTGPVRQWYLQLGREMRTSREKLTEQFLAQYCGKGVSMASRYYHATKRSDETPLDYLYRLNVVGIRAGLHIMEGSVQQKREHVEHYAVLRKRQYGLDSQKKSLFGSNKYRQKSPVQNGPPRVVHAIQAGTPPPGSIQLDAEGIWDYGQDYDDEERARLYVTTQRNFELGACRDDPTENGPYPFPVMPSHGEGGIAGTGPDK